MQTILLIDDEADFRDMVAYWLRDTGYEVIEAANGIEGLKLFKICRPDLIITDLVMPECDGIEVIEEVRRRTVDARIIAISGGGAVQPRLYLEMAGKLGADRMLEKPFALEALQALVEELLPRADELACRGDHPDISLKTAENADA